MQIECTCGEVKAQVKNLPKASPGRLICYCDDCQNFLKSIGKENLLDYAGGTEIIPVYPKNFEITSGKEQLKCLRLSPKGLFRWYSSCCNTPFGNVQPGFPWLGLTSIVFKNTDLEKTFGPIRSRVCGKFATNTPPKGASDNFKLRDIFVVAPFLLKGFLFKKFKPSPYFKSDGKTPIIKPEVKNF